MKRQNYFQYHPLIKTLIFNDLGVFLLSTFYSLLPTYTNLIPFFSSEINRFLYKPPTAFLNVFLLIFNVS